MIVFVILGVAAAILVPILKTWLDNQPSPEIICPHCGVKSQVCLRTRTRKRGISGAKATGAIMTGGASLPFTGLSQKGTVREAHCKHCNATWGM